jgi:uncharacterized protein with GYD domain
MATYVVLVNFTEQGIRNIKDTVKRAESFRAAATKAGANVKDFYWTLGQYDGAVIVEAADDAAMTSLALSVGALGNVRTHVLRAFGEQEMNPILGRMT